jgi:hypothetical protein
MATGSFIDSKRLPIFHTNIRLKQMAEKFVINDAVAMTSSHLYTGAEIDYALEIMSKHTNWIQLNPSQDMALRDAIMKPLSLIQGPPGTGKVSMM